MSNDLADSIVTLGVNLEGQKDTLKEINSERKVSADNIKQLNTIQDAEIGSNKRLKAELKLLTAEMELLGEEERDNTDAGKELGAQILKITDNLKENESAVGDNRRNVGNYSSALDGAVGNISLFGVNLGQVSKQLKSGVAGVKGMTTGLVAQATATKGATASSGGLSKAMKVLRIALISTGIGAIVVAVGMLIAAFASTQRGADAFSRVMIPIKAVLSTLVGIVQDLSFALVDGLKGAFEDIKKLNLGDVFKNIGDAIKTNLTNRIAAFGIMGKAIVKIFSKDWKEGFKDLANGTAQLGTGVEDVLGKLADGGEAAKKKLAEVNARIQEGIRQGKLLADMEINLDKARIKSVVTLAEINKNLKEQRLISADMTLTDDERIDALQKAIELSKEKSIEEKKLVQQELEIAQIKASFNDTDREAKMEMATLKAKLLDLDAAALSEAKMMLTMLTGIQLKQRKAEEKRIASIETLIVSEGKLLESKRIAQLESLGLLKEDSELTANEIKAKESIYKKYYNDISSLAISELDTRIKKEQDADVLIALEKQKLYLNDLANFKGTEAERKAFVDQNTRETLTNLKTSLASTLQTLEGELETMTASTGDGIADNIYSEQDKLDLQKRIAETGVSLAQLNVDVAGVGVDADGEPISIADSLKIDEEKMGEVLTGFSAVTQGISSIMGAASDLAKVQADEKVKAIDKSLKAGTISEKEAEAQKQKVRKEAFEKSKKMQIAMATIQIAEGVVAAIAGGMTMGNPILGAIVGAIGAAAVVATGVMNIAKIKAQTFAEGGYVQGAGTGTSDSINAKLSNGEFVQTKKATEHYGTDFMNAVNTLQLPKLNFAEGGLVAPTGINDVSNQISRGEQNIADSISDSQIEVINVESRFTNKQNQVKNVETATTY